MDSPRPLHWFSGHTHDAVDKLAILDQRVAGADRAGTVWTWDLRTGERRACPLDLDAAAPEEQIPDLHGDVQEEYEEVNQADSHYTVSLLTAAELNGRPVVVTGGGFRDLAAILGPEYGGGAVRVWDLESGRKIGRTLTGPDTDIYCLATIPSGRGLLTVARYEDELVAWNLGNGERVARIPSVSGAVTAATLDERPVAVIADHDAGLRVCDLLTGERRTAIPGSAGLRANDVAVTRVKGRTVALIAGSELSMWDLVTGERVHLPSAGQEQIPCHLAVSGTLAVTGDADGCARVWDLTTGEQVGENLTGHHDQVCAVAIGDVDGRPVVATGGLEGGVGVWRPHG
ncbi:PQQ-binding-like beta-propeller repeat protein [Nonomuraea sp. NPDC049695]|uniref:WD40 repeat domain-containing protein n=1 Tax=Nonomuraea sp. NPDC049695 TaxID=3154734 RepID=UPI0034443104